MVALALALTGVLAPVSLATTATEAPLPIGPDAPNTHPYAYLSSVSCASAGNCTAVGSYNDTANSLRGLLVSETNGTSTAAEAPLVSGPDAPNANPYVNLGSVSCASAGNCTAVGSYNDTASYQRGLLLTQTNGTWTATEAPVAVGPDAPNSRPYVYLGSVSCASAANCTAAGSYYDTTNHYRGLLLTQANGVWTATEAPLPAGPDAPNASPNVNLGSVSCASAGNCTAAGTYNDTASYQRGVLFTQANATWTATEAPLPAGPDAPATTANPYVNLSSVSCASAGNCTAAGTYNDTGNYRQGVLVTQATPTGSSWGTSASTGAPSPGSLPAAPATGLAAGLGLGSTPAVGLPSPDFMVRSLRGGPRGTIVLTVTVPGPGGLDVLATHSSAAAAAMVRRTHGRGRYDYARADAVPHRRSTLTLVLHPSHNGRRMLHQHRRGLHLPVWITYTPTGGHTKSTRRGVRVH